MKKINWLIPLVFIIFAGATQAWAPCGLSGYVYCDVNQNGVIDEGDTPYENVRILIDGVPTTIFTDNTGFYYVLDGYVCDATSLPISLDLDTLPEDAIFINPPVNQVAYTYHLEQDWLIDSTTCRPYCGDGYLDSGELCDDGNNVDGDGCSAECTFEVGGEGCTPGYWKQKQHFDSWMGGYSPDTMFSAIFVDAFPGMTLLDVLKQGGGGLKALGRHTVAALLNVTSTGVNYHQTMVEQDVVNMFYDAYMSYEGEDIESVKDIFEYLNEQGCPLN